MHKFDSLEQEAIKEFEAEAKIALIATVNAEGLPHITFISSLRAKAPKQLMWGQFTEGLSKRHVKRNPNTAFLVLNMAKQMWRGKARWSHEEKTGEDFEMYNNTPMFRYNAYFGINTVHYMDMAETYGKENLPLSRLVLSSVLTKIAKIGASTGTESSILKPWAIDLFNRLDALKFIAYVGDDGYPNLIPLIQCQASGSRRVVFSPLAYKDELNAIRKGAKVAVFGLTMDMEDVLIRGTLGYDRFMFTKLGTVDIDWVYNSMPPKQGQIYPIKPLRPVVDF